MIKVSVIVPVYNTEKYLSRCIESVLCQTCRDIELILIDDGSSDASFRICDAYQKEDERVKVIRKENGGVSSARNAGLKEARGDYVLFLDSDDAIDEDAVQTCLEASTPEWDVILFGFHLYSEKDADIVFQKDIVYEEDEILSHQELIDHFSSYYQKGYFSFVTDKLIRTSLIREHDFRFDSSFNVGGEDAVFMLSLIPYLKKIKAISRAFYRYYRRENESMTRLFKPDKFRKYCDRIALLNDFMKANDCFDGKYLAQMTGTYFLWAYESTFHPSCPFNPSERFRYIKKTFRIKDLFEDQDSRLKEVLGDLSSYSDYCGSSRVALKLFLKQRITALGFWSLLTYIRTR